MNFTKFIKMYVGKVVSRVLPLPQLFKATGFSYLFYAHFDKSIDLLRCTVFSNSL